MPARFTIPADTQVAGFGNPPGDVNKIVDAMSAWGYPYSICNTAWAGGAAVDGTSDSTAAIQACMNAAAPAGCPVFIPAGVQFRVSQLTWNTGQVLQGVYSGTYPGSNAITTASVLTRLAGTNLDLITVPDGVNYGKICDIAIDGNKTNNTAGCGIKIADGAAASESQIFIERCYVHDNPDSNIYLGHFRRCNKVIFCVGNYSAFGDGVTDTGSDNLIMNNVFGSNFRAGINLGTSQTQNWAAFGSNQGSNVAHVTDNDVYQNQVGIALSQFCANAMVRGNGIDRNTKQGITVYDGTSNCIEGNSLHSNGTLTNNTYAHIDVAAGVTGVNIASNNVGPLDAGVTNVASWVVNAAAGAAAGCITGDIGVFDATDVVGGLINLPAKRLAGQAWEPADSGFITWAFDPCVCSSAQVTATQIVNLIRVNLRTSASVTNVIVGVSTAGVTLTSGQNFAGLYAGQTAGGYTAGQLIGTSADQSASWVSTGLKTAALAGGPFTLPAGFYWVAILAAGTTIPAFNRGASLSVNSINAGFTAATGRAATVTGVQTSLPSTITPASNVLSGIAYWAALS